MAKPPQQKALEDIQAYPVVLQEDTPSAPGAPSAPGGGGTGSVVQRTIADVLGWQPKQRDPRAFVGALERSFTLTEEAGHRDWTWNPSGFAVQAGIGALTGAQSSIFQRAQAALTQILAIVDGLTPLRPAPDVDKCEAIRSIIRQEVVDLVGELGMEGGPRVQLVDKLWRLLLERNPNLQDPERVKGQLAEMRTQFGFTRTFVTTVDDERILTQFLTLVDWLNSLKTSWDFQRSYFDGSNTARPFLGTQLVLVSRQLAAVAEAVADVRWALSSVFISEAEQQTLLLTGGSQPPILLSGMLEWIDGYAGDEAPRLLQAGGDESITAIRDTLKTLRGQVGRARGPQPTFPDGYRTARVKRALGALQKTVDDAYTYVQQLKARPAPRIDAVRIIAVGPAPGGAAGDIRARLGVEGQNFDTAAGAVQAELVQQGAPKGAAPATVQQAQPILNAKATDFVVIFDIPAGTPQAKWRLEVTQGAQKAVLPTAYETI
jgi:hypothetical protein